MKRILAVASGKGGVGKTWFSVSLAHALARMSRHVLLVDCDIGLANIDVQLGLGPAANIRHAFLGSMSISNVIRPVRGMGLDVLPGRSSAACLNGLDPAMVGWLESELTSVAQDYDIVILDLPSGVEHGVRELMRYADDVVILTTSEPTALTDAYALIKATERERIGDVPNIVCNLAEQEEAGRQTLDGLVSVCDRFLSIRPRKLGVIRRDGRVSSAISRQAPLLDCYPECKAARDVTTIADMLNTLKDGA